MSQDFTETIVFSDIHLGKLKKDKSLWKKYNEAEFSPDQSFSKLLEKITTQKDNLFEFIFNGDIFDFDNVHITSKTIKDRISVFPWKKLNTTQKVSLKKIEIIIKDHRIFFKSLGKVLAKGHSIIFLRGNHDTETTWPSVRNKIRESILQNTQKYINTSEKHSLKIKEKLNKRIKFYDWFYYKKNKFYIEHGNQYDPYNVIPYNLYPFTLGNSIELSYGSVTARLLADRLGFFNPHVQDQFILSGGQYLRYYYKYYKPYKKDMITPWIIGGLQSIRALIHIPRHLLVSKRERHLEKRSKLAKKFKIDEKKLKKLEKLQPSPAVRGKLQVISLLKFDRLLIILTLSVLIPLIIFINAIISLPYFHQSILIISIVDLAAILWTWLGKTETVQINYFEKSQDILKIMDVPNIIMGHTHLAGKKRINENSWYLNPGTWAPAFDDIECTKPVKYKFGFIWIDKDRAKLFQWKDDTLIELHNEPEKLAT